MSQLNDSTENKKCEKYSRVSVTCVNNTPGGFNQSETLPSTGKEETDLPLKESITKKIKRKNTSRMSQMKN